EMLGITEEQQKRKPFVPGSLAGMAMVADTVLTQAHLITPDHPDYIELILKPGMVPYPLQFDKNSGYPLVLAPGDKVDVVMISSLNQNLAEDDDVNSFDGLSVAPLLQSRKVLQVDDGKGGLLGDTGKLTVVLELSRPQVSQLMLAKRVGLLDIHKATGVVLPQVRAGDVLPDFSSVVELRGKAAIRQVQTAN
ncbi:MAG: RcpC/CpaB family pilus assembly protein, partial [Desulfovibrionales bacterium]|nr:RcpC/CpaB family pilus assembly protein [Desulfovibrionales bacterium]